MTYKKEELEALRSRSWFKITNRVWNQTGINSPKHFGYIMPMIAKCAPKTFEDWSHYFEIEVATDEQIKEYARIFKEAVLQDEKLQHSRIYKNLTEQDWCMMVVCRLMYETAIGYFAEQAVTEQLRTLFPDHIFVTLSAEEDNQYAVDRLMYDKKKQLICGIQIKSTNYGNMASAIMRRTVYMNGKKNERFREQFNVPVIYVKYVRTEDDYVIQDDDDGVNRLRELVKEEK